jgi:hypothetical protein
MGARAGVLAVVAFSASLALGASAASARSVTALSAFHTPNWAAYCFVPFPHEAQLSDTGVVCVTPNDGFTISMGARDRVSFRYDRRARGSRDVFAAQRRLAFGQHWAVRPYWGCVSRTKGLTCWNKAGHGWWLGRYRGYRIF